MMKMLNTLLVAAALSGSIVALGGVPAALAQSAAAPAAPAPVAAGAPPAPNGPGGRQGRLIEMSCNVGAATRLESGLDALATRLALSATQQPLFDAYRTAILTAQTSFADTCATTQPAPGGADPDLITVTKNRLALETARVAAVNATLPTLEAFYTSLTDAQKVQFMPLGHGGNGPKQATGAHRGKGRGDNIERGPNGGRDDVGRHGGGRVGSLSAPSISGDIAPATSAAVG